MERANLDATGVRLRRAFLGGPYLAALLLLAGGGVVGCAGGEAIEPRSALLITLDTTRYEAVSCFGEYEGITPFLDAFATEAVRFDAAYTVAPLTLPAHASMLTGLVPPRHGVRENGSFRLPASARTLAELARAAGIQTAAVVGSVVLDESFGLAQGFEVYDSPPLPYHSVSSHAVERPADEVVDRGLAWLAKRDPDRPFFLWLHFFDPHAPYLPPPAFRGGPFASNPYFGEVAFVDAELERFFAAPEAAGVLEEATVLLVADHGEAFGEHGETTHGLLCYQPTLHVPLLLRRPSGARAGAREESVVSVVDVFPTLAEALSIVLPESAHDGRSLLRLGEERGPGAYFESYTPHITYGWAHLAGWVDGEGKYVHGTQPEFFDLARDPREERNLLRGPNGEGIPDGQRYRDAIAERAGRDALAAAPDEAIAPELVQALEKIGYFGTGGADGDRLPHPLAPTDRAAPRERTETFGGLLLAQEAINRQRWSDAESVLAAVLRDDPDNWFALDRYAVCLIEQGRAPEAIAPLKRLLRERREREDSHFNLAICLEVAGRVDEAIDHLTIAVELRPHDIRFLDTLIGLLEKEERDEAGARYRAMRARAQDGRE